MHITLNPKLEMSVINNRGSYSSDDSVEIGFPTQPIPELKKYQVGDEDPTESVYSHVPLTILADIITKYHKPNGN